MNHHEEKDDPPINDVDDFAARVRPSVIWRMLDPRIGGPTVMGVDIAVKLEGKGPRVTFATCRCAGGARAPRAQRLPRRLNDLNLFAVDVVDLTESEVLVLHRPQRQVS